MSIRYSKNSFSLAAFLCMSALSAAQQKNPDCIGPETLRVSARHIETKGIGYNSGYTSLDLFLAPSKEMMILPFADLRGHAFNNGNWAANVGVGIRGIPESFSTVLGINAYYDWRNTTKKSYNQGSLGIEALGTVWEFRANGYLPFGTKKSRNFGLKFHEFKGHNIIVQKQIEFAMWGVDAEAGAHFKRIKDFDFYAAAGPYYFSGPVGKNAVGGKLRLWGQWKDYVRVEVMNSYDSVFNEIVQGQVIFSYPFGPKPKLTRKVSDGTCPRLQLLAERKVQRVERQEIIVVDRHKQHRVAINPATGDPFEVFFVNNTSHSDGTAESPFPTLVQAQNASDINDIIYVFAGDGTSNGMDAGITLQDGQKLLGSGAEHPLQTTLGSITIPVQGTFPIITNTPTAISTSITPIVTLANNNEVAGLQIGLYTLQSPEFTTSSLTATGIQNQPTTSNVLIRNNNFSNSETNIALDNGPTIGTQNYSIYSNNFFAPANADVMNTSINAVTTAPSQILSIVGNFISGQIMVSTTSTNEVLLITDNSMLGNTLGPLTLSFTDGNTALNISNNTINGTTSTITSASGTLNGSITGNTINAGSTTAISIMAEENGVQQLYFMNNDVVANQTLSLTASASSQTIEINNNILTCPTFLSPAIEFSNDTSGTQTVSLFNNTLSTFMVGVQGGPGAGCVADVTIIDNLFQHIFQTAIDVTSAGGTLNLTEQNNLVRQ